MQHDDHTPAPTGWDGYIAGEMYARDERIRATGGWPSDPRSILLRVADLLATYALLLVVMLAAMAAATMLLRALT